MPSIDSRLIAHPSEIADPSPPPSTSPGRPVAPNADPGMSPVLRCPLPVLTIPSPDNLRQYYSGGSVPQYRFPAPPPISTVLRADTETGPWTPVAISASTPCPSALHESRHAYVTTRGILVYHCQRQLAITWEELFALLETIAPEIKGKTPVKQPVLPPFPAPAKQPAK